MIRRALTLISLVPFVIACGDTSVVTTSESTISSNPADVEAPSDNKAEDVGDKPVANAVQRLESLSFCIVTHFTQTDFEFPYIAVANHKSYAERHSYGQREYTGRISGELFVDPSRGTIDTLYGGGLYWQKLVALKNVMSESLDQSGLRRCEWVMWIDADAIITNLELSLLDIVSHSLHDTPDTDREKIHVILTRDVYGPVNAGVFFVRNSPIGRAFVEAVTSMYDSYKQETLPEQAAIAALAFDDRTQNQNLLERKWHENILVVPQRMFNSFVADPSRPDGPFPPHASWQPGDFVAHFPSIEPRRRGIVMRKFIASLNRDK